MSTNFGEIELVLKGGQPWGFKLRANSNKCSSVIVDEIVSGEKAHQQGGLKVGDRLIKINGIQCLSLADAQQLIDSAFRTLTVLVWRSREPFEDDTYISSISLQKCGRKSSYVPCQPFFKCFSTLSIYKNSNDVTYEEQLLSSKENSSVKTSAYKNTMKTLQNSMSNYSNNFQISANEMTVFCAPNLSSSKNSESSHLIHGFGKESQNIPCCKEKSSLSLKELYLKDMPHLNNKLYFSHSSAVSEHNLKFNSVLSHCNQSLTSSIQIQKSAVISGTFSENPYHCSKYDLSVLKPYESCCMYPNCHNKYMNCKMHCLPERDIVCLKDQLIKGKKCKSNFLHNPQSESKCSDQSNILLAEKSPYENCFGNLSSGYLLNKYQMLPKNMKQENTKLLNLSDEPNVPSSNIYSELKFKNITNSGISESMSNSQSMHLKEKDQNSLSPNQISLCYFDEIFNENLHPKSEPISPNYVNVSDLHKDVFLNQLSQNSSVGVKETNKYALHSCTNSLTSPTSNRRINGQTFSNYKQFDELHNSSATNKIEGLIRTISSNTEDENELCLIEKNKASSYITPSSSIIGTPPLPPPPLETEIEIISSDVALPPPPFFCNENYYPIAHKKSSIPETIYENLEMVQIHCSVVNSSTQTSLDKQKQFATESSEVSQNCALQIKNASSYLERNDTTLRKYTQSKLQSNTLFMKSMLYDQNEKSLKNSLSLPLTSAYFTTSTPKAKFLTRYTSKVHLQNEAIEKELSNKKDELMSSIASKVDILLQEQASLQGEVQQNEKLGSSLVTKLEKCAKLNEVSKFKVHIEELEKITNLLLSLSGRLARTKSALLILPSGAATEEKILLEEKLCKLNQQYNEAMYLQENINQRSNQISFILNKYLTGEECADYKHFIKMKVKLLMDYKELVEKIKLGKEQLSALRSSIKTMDMY